MSHTRFIVACIAVLSAIAMGLGFYLLLRGYQSGELLITNGGVGGISGLIGYLGGKPTDSKPPANITVEPPSTVTVNQPPAQPGA